MSAVADGPILDTVLMPGTGFSRVCRRGTSLTIVDLRGGANVPMLLYRAEDPRERYCMPDTLKAQHVCRLTTGLALYSDMGRVLASIVDDTVGWHDTITGHSTAANVADRWGALSYGKALNEWRRSARDAFVVELAKHGLGVRDLVANANLFTKIAVGEAGELEFVAGHSPAGGQLTLRIELDVLVILTCTPHPLDPTREWEPKPVRLVVEPCPPAGADDRVRRACPENERGFEATEDALR